MAIRLPMILSTVFWSFLPMALWYFLTKSKVVRIHRVRLESSLISEILGVGFSAMLMQVMTMVPT